MGDRPRLFDHFVLALSLFPILYLPAVVADDLTNGVGDLPICGQVCITTAFTHCKCKLADFLCSCSCLDFESSFKLCVKSSCASEYLKSAESLISTACPTITESVKAVASVSSTSSTSSVTKPVITSSTLTSSSISTSTSNPSSTYLLNPTWPTLIVGPACVPIHNMPNSSIPDHGNWTDGIVWTNGTWKNSSCTPNSTNGNYPEQVSVNGGAMVATGLSSIAVASLIASLFIFT